MINQNETLTRSLFNLGIAIEDCVPSIEEGNYEVCINEKD